MSKRNFNRNFAIIIGINDYINDIRKLETAVPDAEKLAEIIGNGHVALKQQYQKENKYEVLLILDQSATLNQLNILIEELKKGQISFDNEKVTVTEDDRVLFYFAGHGLAKDALENQEGPVGYLIPQDAKSDDSSTFLPMQELHDALNALPCKHMLAILDCCFAGAFRWASLKRQIVPRSKVYKERYDRFISDAAWQVITSASDDQKALDSLGKRGKVKEGDEVHSPFAKALFDALLEKGADLNQDGIITATEVYSYLRDRVEILTETHYQRQTPSLCPLRKHGKGEFIFLSPDFNRDKLEDAPPLDEENNPYRGLSSYDEKDSNLFFGREEQIQKLYQKVVDNKQPLTLVLGASGTGKSSLVKAGLIPQLRKDDKTWRILPPFRPGESPFKSLNNVLESVKQPLIKAATASRLFTPVEESLENWVKNNPQVKLLVVIDQFEELITLSKSEEGEKFQIFIKNSLVKYPNNIHVVITLRLDFEAQFQTSVLKDFWNHDTRFVIAPMSQNEFREAIEKPALEKVIYFDPPSLIDELINEVVQMPGALPLLSFTLSELYLKYSDDRTRNNRALTKKDYEELGGVVGSLTKRTNQEYEKLVAENPAYKDTVRRVMLRMVSLQGGELARRQVPKSELVYPSQEESDRVQIVIKRFSEARLIVEGSNSEDKPYVEPAHDALVCGWDQLLVWKKEDEEKIILQRRLTPYAEEWKSVTKKLQPSGLQTTTENVLDWLDGGLYVAENIFNTINAQVVRLWWWKQKQQDSVREKPAQFLWDNNPYLNVVNEQLQFNHNWLNQLEAEFVGRSIKRRRQNTSVRWGIALSVMLGLSGLTIWALRNLRDAQIEGISALIETSGANLLSDNQVDAMVVAIKAKKKLDNLWIGKDDVSLRTLGSLVQTVHHNQEGLQERLRLEGTDVVLSPDGKLLATKDNNIARVWNASTGKLLHTLKGDENRVYGVVFSPDGKQLATASFDNTARVWDAATGKLLHTLKGHEDSVYSVVFSPDGKQLATASNDTTARVWDAANGKLLHTLKGHEIIVNSVVFSPNGKQLATASDDKTARVWDVATGKLLHTLKEHESDLNSVVFSPNDKQLATASEDNTARVWDAATGKLLHTLKGHEDDVKSVVFSPDGKQLATASFDKTARVWDAATGKLLHTLKGHEDWVMSVVFSPDGKQLATASFDKTARVWDAATDKLLNTLKGHEDSVISVVFSPNGKQLATASIDKTARVWDAATGKLLHTLKGHEDSVYSVVFSPDGKQLATASDETTARVWDVATGKLLHTLKGHEDDVKSVVFSPDGKQLATASFDNTARVWDAANGKLLHTLKGHKIIVNSVVFSPNGKQLATASDDKTARVWDAATGKLLHTLKGHEDSVYSVVFSPDGKQLATASNETTARVWRVGDIDDMLAISCDWVRHYLESNPNVDESDKHLCDDVPEPVTKDKSS